MLNCDCVLVHMRLYKKAEIINFSIKSPLDVLSKTAVHSPHSRAISSRGKYPADSYSERHCQLNCYDPGIGDAQDRRNLQLHLVLIVAYCSVL